MWADVGTAASQLWFIIKFYAKKWYQEFIDWKNNVIATIEEWKNNLNTTVMQLGVIIVFYINDMKNKAIARFLEMKNDAISRFTDMKNAIILKVHEWYDAVVSKVTDIKNGTIAKFSEMKNTLVAKLNEIKQSISNYLTQARDNIVNIDWVSAGLEIMNSLAEGVASGAGVLYAAILKAIKYAMTALTPGTGGTGTGGGVGPPPHGQDQLHDAMQNIKHFGDQVSQATLAAIATITQKLSLGGALSSFGDALITRFQAKTIAPLQKTADKIQAQIDAVNSTLSSGTNPTTGKDLTDAEKNALIAQRTALIAQQTVATKNLADANSEVTKLQQKQADLNFLKSQMDFISFLRDNKIDPKSIVGNFQFGLNADVSKLMDLMVAGLTKASNSVSTLLSNTNWSSGVSGTSAKDILSKAADLQTTNLPHMQNATPAQVITNQTNNYNLNIHTSAKVEPIIADFEMMKSMSG